MAAIEKARLQSHLNTGKRNTEAMIEQQMMKKTQVQQQQSSMPTTSTRSDDA